MYSNWSSFDFPTDTILPNQSIKAETQLISSNGKFRFSNSSSLVFNSTTYWAADKPLQFLDYNGQIEQTDTSFITADFGSRRNRRLKLDDDGNLKIYSFNPASSQWEVVWQAVQEICKIYGTCGPNYICRTNIGSDTPICECPPGFREKSGSGGKFCSRNIALTTTADDKFLPLEYVNYSGGSNQTNILARNRMDCLKACLANPTCLGFGFKLDGKNYCVLQLERLLYGYWSPGTEAIMYLRVHKDESDPLNYTGMTQLLTTTCPVTISLPLPPGDSNATARNIAIICTLFAAELVTGVLFFWAFLKQYIKYRDMARTLGLELLPAGGPKRFSYADLKAATNDFSTLVGKGGFGDVYKGELSDRRVVAIKRLKKVTGGDSEFWAEVTIIARMHHLNLVRLWGFCAEKGQRILVYEYVPNGSLDKYLFPPSRVKSEEENRVAEKPMLEWNIRYRIALGVARAIAYLHEECLEWVLHCDIKPENILLGDDFCPKISDFGLAKLRKKEDMVSKSRIRGTRGYMAPEWTKSDPITRKADVYSFGMVLLEIVLGVRNFEIQGSANSEDWYFPRWTYDKIYKENNLEEILDRRIKHCYDNGTHFRMVDRMVKTALWCLQDQPDMRPSMGKVAKMIEGTVDITEPPKPTIYYLGDE